jgi:hypothetical protein
MPEKTSGEMERLMIAADEGIENQDVLIIDHEPIHELNPKP